MKKNTLDEIVGWTGAICVISAYILLSAGYTTPDDIIYPILNGVGALAVGYVALKHHDYQPAVLNIVRACIAIVSLIKLIFS